MDDNRFLLFEISYISCNKWPCDKWLCCNDDDELPWCEWWGWIKFDETIDDDDDVGGSIVDDDDDDTPWCCWWWCNIDIDVGGSCEGGTDADIRPACINGFGDDDDCGPTPCWDCWWIRWCGCCCCCCGCEWWLIIGADDAADDIVIGDGIETIVVVAAVLEFK